ncbi:MAG: antitoxin family protein [Lacipirellulaceae bacterium]
MKTVQAVFENGMFRPTEPVELPENCRVEFVPIVVGEPDDPRHRERVEQILSARFTSGQGDLAARHDEHQP